MSARKSKLRASCDACGAAKVKCDRGQPSCGRCLLQDTPCVYGICRRNGKPTTSKTPVRHSDDSLNNEDSWSIGDAIQIPLDLDLLPTPQSSPTQPNATQTIQPSLLTSTTTQDNDAFTYFLHQHPFISPVHDDLGAGTGRGPTFSASDGLPSLPNHLQDHHNTTNQQPPLLDNTNIWPTAQPDRHQKCTLEAYDILGDLILMPCQQLLTAESRSDSVSTQQRPLDQILYLNRKCSERLRRLLTCTCTKSPGLTMVHASAIWRILQAYQQAANTISRTSPAIPRHDSMMAQSSTSLPPLFRPRESSSENAMDHDSGMTSSSTQQHGRASSQISVGSFIIDDDQAKTTLSLQLLSLEMQRIKSLICLLSNGKNTNHAEMPFTDAADDLDQSLRLWIRREYIKTESLVKARSLGMST